MPADERGLLRAVAAPDYAATIDLSATTTSGPGYAVTGSTPPYANPNGPVDGDRTLTFQPAANGLTYHLTQEGRQVTPPDPSAPKDGTSIFATVRIEGGIAVTLVLTAIDLPGSVVVAAGSSLTLLLDDTSHVRGHIEVPDTAALTIDSIDGTDAGRLVIPSKPNSTNTAASIGGNGTDAGAITIDGGAIDITARSAGAGIGGSGPVGSHTLGYGGGTIAINGGTVSVTQYGSGDDLGTGIAGAGIGGGGSTTNLGSGTSAPTTVAINGGEVHVTQYANAAGIGAGKFGPVGYVTINGGLVDVSVIAKGAKAGEGSAIGAGSGTSRQGPSEVTITGGTVRAASASFGAGIGEVNSGLTMSITITGGDVVATSVDGAGIGVLNTPHDSTVTITGGTVVAQSTSGVGIGGLNGSALGFCLGTGADVTAVSAGKHPAFGVLDNTCDGYYVNARLNKALSTTAEGHIDAHRGVPVASLHLPAGFVNFGYATRGSSPEFDSVLASVSGTPVGTLVRSADKSPQIYSIQALYQYNPHNGNAGTGVLPVELAPVMPGVPSVTDVGFEDAVFHSAHQYLGALGFVGGGFLYSMSPGVDVTGKLNGADVTMLPWTAFSADEIRAAVAGLARGTTYYLQTYLATSAGTYYSEEVAFTTHSITALDLSATTTGGPGYTVSGVTPGTDEYASRFPAADGTIDAPTGVLTFTPDADGGVYRFVQSGVLAAPTDPAEPKHGTSIFTHVVVPDGLTLTATIESIDLIGTITLEGTASLTLLLDIDGTYASGPAGSFIHGGIVVPVSDAGVASLFIDDATPGRGASLTVRQGDSAGVAAIGGHDPGQAAGSITIAGGVVNAQTAGSGAAIGGATGGGATIAITGGVVTATGGFGAGIGGGAGGPAAALTIGADAVVTAYSLSANLPGTKSAIDMDTAGNRGDGFFVNAVLSQSAVTGPLDLLVFPDGYTGGDPADRIATLSLPASYRGFAYTTGGVSRADNLYADLGPSATLGRVDFRVVERVKDRAKPVYAIATLSGYDADNPATSRGRGVLQLTLRQVPVAGVPSAAATGAHDAALTSTGHVLGAGEFVGIGFLYAALADAGGRPDPTQSVDLSSGVIAFDSAPVTRNTHDDPAAAPLVPNTRYFVVAYLRADVDLYLDVPAGVQTFVSEAVAQVVTWPSIASGSVVGGPATGEATLEAAFDGGTEPLSATVVWSTSPVGPSDTSPAPGRHVATLATSVDGLDPVGIAGFVLTDLAPGETYHVLLVLTNESGTDTLALTYVGSFAVAFVKVDETGAPMANVAFQLRPCAPDDVAPPGLVEVVCVGGDAAATVSGADGAVTFSGLVAGAYVLVETSTQPGYQLPQGQWWVVVGTGPDPQIAAQPKDPAVPPPAFKVGDDGRWLLPNYRQMAIPPLGGAGEIPWILAGLGLLATALALGGRTARTSVEPALGDRSALTSVELVETAVPVNPFVSTGAAGGSSLRRRAPNRGGRERRP